VILQFAKYTVCGTLATGVQLVCFYLFATYVWPEALDRSLADEIRRDGAVFSNVLAFPISNTFAYVTNAIWVFTGGRHGRLKEFVLFTFVSSISFAAGLVAGPQLIRWFGISTHLAQASFIASSALVNFIVRKFVVFQG
jgi:putative flippase GtrA